MKAVQLLRFGEPDVLDVANVPKPLVGRGEALIRVEASGVNFTDTRMRQNSYVVTPPLPSILGGEVAGVIESLGPGVEGLEVGDRVAGSLFAAGRLFGGYSQYVALAADFVTPIPDALPFEHAVALMVQGITAFYLLRQAPVSGRRVFISAAAGGVGTLLLQLAKRAGATQVIAAASSPEKRAFVSALGADETVDYTAPRWSQRVRELTQGAGVDVIYESSGGTTTLESMKALAPLGRLIVYGASNAGGLALGAAELTGLIFGNQSITGFALVPLLTPQGLRDALGSLFSMAIAGELKVTIGGAFPLEKAADAHRALESRQSRGKSCWSRTSCFGSTKLNDLRTAVIEEKRQGARSCVRKSSRVSHFRACRPKAFEGPRSPYPGEKPGPICSSGGLRVARSATCTSSPSPHAIRS